MKTVDKLRVPFSHHKPYLKLINQFSIDLKSNLLSCHMPDGFCDALDVDKHCVMSWKASMVIRDIIRY